MARIAVVKNGVVKNIIIANGENPAAGWVDITSRPTVVKGDLYDLATSTFTKPPEVHRPPKTAISKDDLNAALTEEEFEAIFTSEDKKVIKVVDRIQFYMLMGRKVKQDTAQKFLTTLVAAGIFTPARAAEIAASLMAQ
jgi:hypothetical protein